MDIDFKKAKQEAKRILKNDKGSKNLALAYLDILRYSERLDKKHNRISDIINGY